MFQQDGLQCGGVKQVIIGGILPSVGMSGTLGFFPPTPEVPHKHGEQNQKKENL